MTLTLTKFEKTFGWLYLLLDMMAVPFAVQLVCALLGQSSVAVINLVCFFINAGLASIFFHKLLGKSLSAARQDWGQTVSVAAQGFGLYWAVNLAVNTAILFLKPDFANVNDSNINGMIAEAPVLMTLAVIVAAPLAEECLFRGWIFTGLAEKSVPLAYGVTCCVFSAAHVLPYLGTHDPLTLLLCFLQYLGPSFALCRTCRQHNSLAAPLLLHMTINAMSCALMPLLGG